MSGNGAQTRIYVFVLILNIVFPVLGYTFTAFGEDTQDYEISLDPDALMAAGITLSDAESHNISYEAPWVVFDELNTTIRARWLYGAIAFQKRSPIGWAFNSWRFPYVIDVKSVLSNRWHGSIKNSTIVIDFNTEYNWTRFILEDGHHIFVTPYADDGNMSKAIWDDGHVNVTIAKNFEEKGTNFNFWNFLGWYTALIIGDQSWGLPSIFSWFIRILAAISIFAIVMLTKDLIRL